MKGINIKEIAKTMTYNEFIEEYKCNDLCPSSYKLKERKDCNDIKCELCWESALEGIEFNM